MDVRKEDISVIFNIMDEDQSGAVTYKEFVEQLHKMKTQDTHTLLVFIKGYVNELRLKVGEQLSLLKKEVVGKTNELLSSVKLLTGVPLPSETGITSEDK